MSSMYLECIFVLCQSLFLPKQNKLRMHNLMDPFFFRLLCACALCIMMKIMVSSDFCTFFSQIVTTAIHSDFELLLNMFLV